ncbi:hypothetical protein [Deinococcus sonorensis]|uniref:Uncharacterized protein n=2 Tax=Deinococcus sonorensis TaxID=309891 RepID=A0AAU7UBB3_9DEIO
MDDADRRYAAHARKEARTVADILGEVTTALDGLSDEQIVAEWYERQRRMEAALKQQR